MATITQRLAFLISANADQAIKAFDKTASAAEKQMGRANKSIDKLGASMTKFGAAGLAAAGTLGAGLFKLAQGAIEDQKAQALLAEQLRSTAGATQAQINAVEKLIDSTARATGFTDDQLRPAFANLVRIFGDTDKASRVLSTALDLARATGRDLESVTLALGRAAGGSTGALSRLGIVLDEGAKASKDFDTILAAVNDKVGGQAAAFAETYAGKIERVKVAIGEAGEAIGEAFVPIIEDVSSIVAKGVNIFDEFNDTTGGLVGKIAAFGTVGLGAVSAMSLVVGQGIKLRNMFFVVDEATGKATFSMTKFGKAALGASAIIGAAIVVYSQYSANKRETEERTLKLAEALDLEGEAQRRALGELAKTDDKTKGYIDTLNLVGLSVADFESAIDGNATGFDRLRTALDEYRKMAGYAGAEDRFAEAIGYQGELTNGQIMKIQQLVNELDRQIDAQNRAADAMDATNQALGQLGYGYTDAMLRGEDYQKAIKDFVDSQASEKYNEIVQKRKDALERQAKAEREAAKAAEDFRRKVIDQAKAVRDNLNAALETARQKLDAAVQAYKSYRSEVSGAITGTLSLAEAQATANDNARSIADAQTDVNEAQARYNALLADKKADQKDVADARQELADATTALNTALKAPVDFLAVFKNQETAAKDFASNIQRLLNLNADRAVTDQLVAAGAETGNQIAAAILNSADPAGKVAEINQIVASTQKIADDLGTNAAEKYFSNGVTLAQNLVNGINSILSKAEIKLKWRALNKDGKPLKRLNSLTDLFQSQISAQFQTAGVTEDIPRLADGGIVRARPGGTLALLGEGGRDEMVLPLPAKPQQGATIVLNVSAGLGADGTQIGRAIVDELVAYQRRVGALPIKVVG